MESKYYSERFFNHKGIVPNNGYRDEYADVMTVNESDVNLDYSGLSKEELAVVCRELRHRAEMYAEAHCACRRAYNKIMGYID